jgi:hypothetical protein
MLKAHTKMFESGGFGCSDFKFLSVLAILDWAEENLVQSQMTPDPLSVGFVSKALTGLYLQDSISSIR